MTSDTPIRIEKLHRHHDRPGFDCGESRLNEYLQKYALQNTEKGVGATYVAVLEGQNRILAYYSISSGQVAREVLPEQKTIPRYPVPVVKIGRLASDLRERGAGMGSLILVDALKRCLSIADVLGVYAVEFDAINDTARTFYEKHGFRPLLDDSRHLYLPIKTIRKLFL